LGGQNKEATKREVRPEREGGRSVIGRARNSTILDAGVVPLKYFPRHGQVFMEKKLRNKNQWEVGIGKNVRTSNMERVGLQGDKCIPSRRVSARRRVRTVPKSDVCTGCKGLAAARASGGKGS